MRPNEEPQRHRRFPRSRFFIYTLYACEYGSQLSQVEDVREGLTEVIHKVERLAEDFPSDKDFYFNNNFPQFKSPVKSIQLQAEALLNEIGLARNLRLETIDFPSDPNESYYWLVSLQDNLVEGIDTAVDHLNLHMLHPFMPYLTEELWQWLPQRERSQPKLSICLAEYPAVNQVTAHLMHLTLSSRGGALDNKMVTAESCAKILLIEH